MCDVMFTLNTWRDFYRDDSSLIRSIGFSTCGSDCASPQVRDVQMKARLAAQGIEYKDPLYGGVVDSCDVSI